MPDAIICALPTVALAAAAVRFAQRHRVPVAVDVRGVQPEVLLTAVPSVLRPIVRVLLGRYRRLAFQALSGAHAVLASSSSYQNWGLGHARRAANALDAVFAQTIPASIGQADDATTLYARFAQWVEKFAANGVEAE